MQIPPFVSLCKQLYGFCSHERRHSVDCICNVMWHSHLNDMEISERKRFIPRGFELSTTELADLVYFVEEKTCTVC